MNEIICPNCKKAFKIDETGFEEIVRQVRNHQFEEELQNRLNLAEKDKESAIKLAEANVRNNLQEQISKKDKELLELKNQSEIILAEKLNKKEAEIMEITSELNKLDMEDAMEEKKKEMKHKQEMERKKKEEEEENKKIVELLNAEFDKMEEEDRIEKKKELEKELEEMDKEMKEIEMEKKEIQKELKSL